MGIYHTWGLCWNLCLYSLIPKVLAPRRVPWHKQHIVTIPAGVRELLERDCTSPPWSFTGAGVINSISCNLGFPFHFFPLIIFSSLLNSISLCISDQWHPHPLCATPAIGPVASHQILVPHPTTLLTEGVKTGHEVSLERGMSLDYMFTSHDTIRYGTVANWGSKECLIFICKYGINLRISNKNSVGELGFSIASGINLSPQMLTKSPAIYPFSPHLPSSAGCQGKIILL